jgi:ATP phosphoribosyltransferase regulatory subunit
MMNSLGLPPGFRDVLFEEARARRSIEGKLAGVFEHRGYKEVVPSTVEFLDLYTRGKQSIKDRVYRFLDRQDNLLALRADFTPAVARIVSTRAPAAETPMKVWYVGSVFRKVEPEQGRFCEFTQVGAELLGTNSVATDTEIIGTALSCLSSLGISNVLVHINHVGIFRGIVDAMGLDSMALSLVKSELDRKDTRALASRLQKLDVPGDVQAQLHALTGMIGGEDVLVEARAQIRNEQSRMALAELDGLAAALAPWKQYLCYDLTEVDELEYYTGVMFKFFSPRLRVELGGGGRYDALMREFGTEMPAIGFSFSLESLMELV